MKALRELRQRQDIVISRPDKGRAAVILNRSDYVNKMMSILNDATKFQVLGPVATHDKTMAVELRLTKFLNKLKASREISESEFDCL